MAKDLTPAQIRAYRIADNKSADLATWDYDLLPIELSELQAMDYDLELLGFSADELAGLLDSEVKEGLTDPDEVPEPPDEPKTKPGDLWILGDHRLLCGDSSKPEDLDRLTGGAEFDVTSNTDGNDEYKTTRKVDDSSPDSRRQSTVTRTDKPSADLTTAGTVTIKSGHTTADTGLPACRPVRLRLRPGRQPHRATGPHRPDRRGVARHP